jgi:S-adenosylmethionine hydrolase
MARPVLALLTDFGHRDHYVAAMKAVALGIEPDVTFVDITHDVPAQDVTAAAFELDAVYRDFPQNTVFLVVVDPGVGSARRGVAVDAGGYRFVGPDNGVFSLVLHAQPRATAVEITEPRFMRPAISRTFEGRDRFAPAAAWLARGTSLDALGPAITDLHLLDLPVARVEDDVVTGVIVRVDHFGNLITNVARDLLASLGPSPSLTIGSARIPRHVTTYADAADGQLCTLVGSSERLEIAVVNGSAHDLLGVGRGTRVQVQRGA